MSEPSDRQAWADFWNRGESGGCLASAAHPIGQAQRAVWEAFARQLPGEAHVLDIGSGDGAALMHLARVRSDLTLIGVDSSPRLPPAGDGITLMENVEAEQLPFEGRTFDAVISQFGFEYADTAKAAAEIGRVLRPGGRVQLMIHRRDSAVVEHNLGRREALRWALECGQVEAARALLEGPAARRRSVPREMHAAFEQAKRLFPRQSVAAEFTAAIAQAVSQVADAGAARQWLDRLVTKARGEMARLDALDRAARDLPGIERMLAEMRSAGIAVQSPVTVEEVGSKRPFAWLVAGALPAKD